MSDTTLATEKETSPQPRLRDALTPRITIIFLIFLFSTITLYMVQPFFMIYFKQALGFSTAQAGLLVGLPFVPAILFGVLGGYLADRMGIIRAYTFAMAVYALAIGGLAFIHSFIFAFILMFVAGMAMAVMTGGIHSILNQSAAPEYRGLLQNYLYWLGNVAVILGLLISSWLMQAGHSNMPIILLGIVRLLLCVAILIFLWPRRSESSVEDGGKKTPSSSPSMLATFKFAFTDKVLLFTAFTFFITMIMESQVDATIPLFFTEHIKNGVGLFGPIMAINAVVVIGCQPLAVKFFTKKKPNSVFAFGVLCAGVGMALGGIVGTIWAWAIGIVLYSIGEVLLSIKLNNLMGELPTPGNEALYFGMIGTAQNLAFFLGITLGSIVYYAFNPAALFGSMIVLAVIAAVSFRFATKAFQWRSLRDMAHADTAHLKVSGTEVADEPSPVAQIGSSGEINEVVQGAASFIPRRKLRDKSVFGIPSPANKVTFLQGLSKDEWERIYSYTETRRFTPFEMVLDIGQADRSLYMVMEGELEILLPDTDNDSEYRKLAVVEAGSVFGEQTFIDGRSRSASIRATEEGELRRMDWQDFMELSKKEPELAQLILSELATVLSVRLRETTNYLNLLYEA